MDDRPDPRRIRGNRAGEIERGYRITDHQAQDQRIPAGRIQRHPMPTRPGSPIAVEIDMEPPCIREPERLARAPIDSMPESLAHHLGLDQILQDEWRVVRSIHPLRTAHHEQRRQTDQGHRPGSGASRAPERAQVGTVRGLDRAPCEPPGRRPSHGKSGFSKSNPNKAGFSPITAAEKM